MRIGPDIVLFLAFFGSVRALVRKQRPTGAAITGKPKLVHVAVIFRHGDRAPCVSFPWDSKPGRVWPLGYSQLTTRGRQTMWALGKWLRKRYGHFLTWDVREVIARSSPKRRCYDSAAILLYGLYTAHGEQRKWNPGQDWQPVVITTLPGGTDKYSTHCEKRLWDAADTVRALKIPPDLQSRYRNSRSKPSQAFETAGDVCAYWARMANITDERGLMRFFGVAHLLDALLVTHEYGMQLPEWASTYLHLLDWANQMVIEWISRVEMDNMAGAMLMDIVAKLRFSKVEGLSLTQGKDDARPSEKITLLSYHDLNIAGVLLGLNGTLYGRPPYGSAVILEAFTRSGDTTPQLYVRVLYKAGKELTNLAIEGCEDPCAIEKFDEFLHRKYRPVTRAQCGWSEQQPLL